MQSAAGPARSTQLPGIYGYLKWAGCLVVHVEWMMVFSSHPDLTPCLSVDVASRGLQSRGSLGTLEIRLAMDSWPPTVLAHPVMSRDPRPEDQDRSDGSKLKRLLTRRILMHEPEMGGYNLWLMGRSWVVELNGETVAYITSYIQTERSFIWILFISLACLALAGHPLYHRTHGIGPGTVYLVGMEPLDLSQWRGSPVRVCPKVPYQPDPTLLRVPMGDTYSSLRSTDKIIGNHRNNRKNKNALSWSAALSSAHREAGQGARSQIRYFKVPAHLMVVCTSINDLLYPKTSGLSDSVSTLVTYGFTWYTHRQLSCRASVFEFALINQW
ncbi:uncharacterized protein CLUP02_01017 [Colletotrichum lupini]|uniref:Uncharacterized protein n=1 Tax=Colletotrichum lupini TaxID=145971 RepID=A0A9Q8SBW1_9PEZI|nr:uncharacterized protein CLUP02_01017 [Colletotrichum lupini]UQC74369.1 hypothetical protein CLUP02_01017 [Colletotrichum lupini]